MGLRSDFPTALISHFPKFGRKTHFGRQLMRAAHRNKAEGCADGHKHPFPPSSEAALAGIERSEECGGGGMKPEGSKGSIPSLCPRAGELLPTHQIQATLCFIQPAARVFLQGTTVQRCIMITRAPRCLNQPVQQGTRKLSFFCLLKILSQLKADKAAGGACKSASRVGVFVLTHISPPSRHFSVFIFIAEVF